MTKTRTAPRTTERQFRDLDKEFHFDRAYGHTTPTLEKPPVESWEGERVFCHPSPGVVGAWAEKCSEEGRKPGTTIVLLAPAKTDASYFHDYILGRSVIRWIQGRLLGPDGARPACGSLVAIYQGPHKVGTKVEILELLLNHSLTAGEILLALNRKGYQLSINGITSRMSELHKAGKVYKNGRRECRVSGRVATEWRWEPWEV